jgi:hypothetical protein
MSLLLLASLFALTLACVRHGGPPHGFGMSDGGGL